MQVEFPGPGSPGPPAVSLVIPDNWDQVVSPGSLIAATKRTEGQVFRANIMVTWVRQSVEFQLSEAAEVVEVELRDQPDASMLEPVELDVEGIQGIGRAAAFTQPDVGALAQFHLMFLVRGDGVSDLIHVTGTIGGDRVADDFPEVREILRSVRLRPGTVTVK